MKEYSFLDDYSEGAHPDILRKLVDTNLIQQEGYGEDEYSRLAKKLIQKHLKNDAPAIHFVSGGTQANIIVISSLLRPHESVIAARSGHIQVHEAGAIEATGHKINTVLSENGKIYPEDIEAILSAHDDRPHMVKPKMVYISNSTEVGSVYSKNELIDLWNYCRTNELILYMDGARLGAALTAPGNDIRLEDIVRYTDVFYIGGTKNGALLGEAIIINKPVLQEDFDFLIKQRGALLSKGRLLGIQFYVLFQEDLFFRLARHANEMAQLLAGNLTQKGIPFLVPPESNQIFPILPNAVISGLKQKFHFHIWRKIDEKYSAIRLVCSWATPEKAVLQLTGFLDTIY